MVTVKAENLLNKAINEVENFLGQPYDLDTYKHFEGVLEILFELEAEIKKKD